MRTILIVPAVALLALTGCNDQKASQAPKNTSSSTEPKTTGQARTSGPAAPAPAPSNTATTAPPSSTVATSNSQTTAASTGSLDAYKGRTFTAGPVSLRLNPDSTFRMDEMDGNRKVEGQWQYTPQSSLLVFSDPKGDTGQAQFPMRCHFQDVGSNAFKLGETAGSCTRFKDMTFKPVAG